MESIFKIEVYQSNARNNETVLDIMKTLPNYEKCIVNRHQVHKCQINTITEYINNFSKIDGLVSMAKNWKKTKIFLNDKKLEGYLIYYRIFQNEMDNKVKKLIDYDFKTTYPDDVAMDIISLDENLQYPIVYYPPAYSPFFAFAKEVNEKPKFCKCQKDSIFKYIDMEKRKNESYSSTVQEASLMKSFPKIIKDCYLKSNTNPYIAFEFEEDICFRCSGKTPKYNYCQSMYGGVFKQKYGWYIKEKYYIYGLMKNNLIDLKHVTNECPAYILDIIKNETDIKKQVERELENIVRKEFNYSLIGEQWINETLMFNILDSIFPDYTVKRHYRPSWLDGLELDAYIPEKNLAFEYNGKQHYEPVKFFGGEEKYLNQIKNDRRKNQICSSRGINLITIKYNENLNANLIQNKISLIENNM